MRIVLYVCLVIITFSCESRSISDRKTLHSAITTSLSQEFIEELDAHNMINYGKNPPNIEGQYLMSPIIITNTFKADGSSIYSENSKIDDYTYTFYSQLSKQPVLALSFIGAKGIDSGKGNRTYISGNENYFTVFSEVNGVADEHSLFPVPYTAKIVFSGEVTSTGIKNFRTYAKVISKSSDYKNEILLPVGYSRILEDKDGFSEKVNGALRMSTEKEQIDDSLLCSLCIPNN